jgi:hypothetical protein
MACNCSKVRSAKGWLYVAPNGTSARYPSEVEAMAAKMRNGNVGEVKPA